MYSPSTKPIESTFDLVKTKGCLSRKTRRSAGGNGGSWTDQDSNADRESAAGRDRAVVEVEKWRREARKAPSCRLGDLLTDFDLDQTIGKKILIEKKSRLAHGEWLPWLYSLPRVSHSSGSAQTFESHDL